MNAKSRFFGNEIPLSRVTIRTENPAVYLSLIVWCVKDFFGDLGL